MIKNPDSIEICEILSNCKTIAVIGLSSKSHRDSRIVAEYLLGKGYNVVGVNPGSIDADGIKVYPSIEDIPMDVDIIDVFRKPDSISEIMPAVIRKKPKVFWLQLGIRNDEAVQPAFEEGIIIVQDKCIKVQHSRCSK
ncbi:CoA-binding protein [Bacteroidota bacterium]